MANDTYWKLRIEKSAIERDFYFLNILKASEVQCGLLIENLRVNLELHSVFDFYDYKNSLRWR